MDWSGHTPSYERLLAAGCKGGAASASSSVEEWRRGCKPRKGCPLGRALKIRLPCSFAGNGTGVARPEIVSYPPGGVTGLKRKCPSCRGHG